MPSQTGELRVLAHLGPFEGLDATTEPAFLADGLASDCNNVDISAKTHAFTIANGRTTVAANLLPAGYYCTGLCMFTEVQGPTLASPAIQGIRLLVISATNLQGATQTLIYNTATGNSVNTTGTLLAFTEATQFQDGIYTNAGQQIRLRSWGGPITLDGFDFVISAWQVARPPASSFVTLSTTTVAHGLGPGPGTYSYAIAFLIGRTTAQDISPYPVATIALGGAITAADTITVTLNNNAVTYTVAVGDTSFAALAVNIANHLNANGTFAGIAVAGANQNIVTITALSQGAAYQYPLTTSMSAGATEVVTPSAGALSGTVAPVYTDTCYQLSQPYYIPGSVTIGAGATTTAPKIAITLPIPNPFPEFFPGGDYTITPILFRSSVLQATYFQIPFSGLGATYVDTSPDAVISGNASILSASIGVPPPFSFFLEQSFIPTGSPSGAAVLTYYDFGFQSAEGFTCSHKGRLWAYALYPNTWDWSVYNSGIAGSGTLLDVLLQAQVWWSSVGVPWQFDAVNGVLPVGPEEVVGNVNTAAATQLPRINAMPWSEGLIEDTPMGMKSIGSELVLLKSNNMYKVWGDTGAEFGVWPIADIGCMAVKSVVPFEGGLGWLAPQGMYFYNGGSPAYVGENVREFIDGLSFAQIQGCIGFYRERTCYQSFPQVMQTVAPVITPETSSATNSGDAYVIEGAQSVTGATETATASISCTTHNQGFSYLCNVRQSSPATWVVNAIAPTTVGTELVFNAASLSGTACNLVLIAPNGQTVASWTGISASTNYSYYNNGALAGAYTWQVTVDLPSYFTSDTNQSGTATSTVTTPTLTYQGGTGTAINGPTTIIPVTSVVAPTTAPNALTLALSSVTTPSDANGSTSYTAILADQTGFVWFEQSGITGTTTLSFDAANAPGGNYTWTVYAVVTVGSGGGSSTYVVSAHLVAGWNEESGGQEETQGYTLAYYTPTQQWYKYNFAVNAAVTSDFPDNLAYVFTDQTLYTWDSNLAGDGASTSITATWTGAVESGQSPGLVKEYRYLVLSAPQEAATCAVTVTITAEGSQIYSWTTPTIDLSDESQAYVVSLPQSGGVAPRGYTAQLAISVNGPPGTVVRNVFLVGTVVRDFSVTPT